MGAPVDRFAGEHRWLSNFYPHSIRFRHIVYPTNEHAFQAMKTRSNALRREIAALPSPGEAKRAGRALDLRPDWDQIKLAVMRECCRRKFLDPDLAAALVATGARRLVEGNTWGDRYWGVYKGVGQNHLGLILMKLRRSLR